MTAARANPYAGPMVDVQPLRALHYDQGVAGPLQCLVAPPYDVIDPWQRAALCERSPYNVVRIDLPEGDDPYGVAAATLRGWQAAGAVVRDDGLAIWALTQEYTGPDGQTKTRRGFFARVRVEDYGPGRIRPHERTHPGPKEDRLNLTRATRVNLSPIFSLFSDPYGRAWAALAPHTEAEPFGEATDADGTQSCLWRIADPDTTAEVQEVTRGAELLIADGHHRYETARVYADEIGGEGEHRYVLMNLVAMEDEGLTVFPTHRLVKDTTPQTQEALAAHCASTSTSSRSAARRPPAGALRRPAELGYLDSHFKQPFRLTLKDQSDRRRGAGRLPRALPPPRHRRARDPSAKGPARPHRRRHRPPARPDVLPHDDEAVRWSAQAKLDLAFLLRPTPCERSRRSPPPASTCPPSPRTSSRRSRPDCCSTH